MSQNAPGSGEEGEGEKAAATVNGKKMLILLISGRKWLSEMFCMKQRCCTHAMIDDIVYMSDILESVVPAEILFIAHFVLVIDRLVSGKNCLYFSTLLVLSTLARCKVLKPLPLFPHSPPKIFIFLYDAVVQLTRITLSLPLEEFQLLRRRVPPCECLTLCYPRWLVCWGIICKGLWNGLAILLVINEAAEVALIEKYLLIHFAHPLATQPFGVLLFIALRRPTAS